MKLQKCLYAGLVVIGLNFLIGSAQSQDNNPVPAVIPVPAINSATAVNSARSISESGLPGMDMKISLDLMQPMEVVDLIKFLTVKGNLNVIFGRDVTGSTKLMLKEVTLGDALDIVLAANGLAWEVKNNILKIMNDKEYRDLYGQGFYEQKKVKVVELRYALPSRVAPMLAEVKGSNGKVVFDDGTGTLILIDTPEQILAMEAVIARADIPTVERVLPTETRAFTLQYAKVEDIQGEILPILTRDIGKMRVDKRTQTLVITDLPHNLGKAAQVIALFDTMPRQVFIEAKIVIVSLNKGFKLGVNWDNVINYINPRAALSIASPFPVTATDQGLGSVSYRTVTGDGDLNAVITALETMGDTKVLSNPHIAVMNGEEATIKVVTDKPYAELMYESGTTNVVGKTYKFIPVGVTLTVTPKINDEKFIQMTVRPEVSDVVDVYDSTDPRYGVPVVQKSYAETKVQVKDGVTIIIAGMIKEDKRETVTGLPFLSRIPLLGALFRSKVTSSENSELIVFLTPKIVTGAEPYLRAKDLKELKLSTTAEK